MCYIFLLARFFSNMYSMNRINEYVYSTINRAKTWFNSLTLMQKIGVVCGLIIHTTISLLIIINYQKIIETIVNASGGIRESGTTGVFVFVILLSLVSFPPLIGFSSLCLIIGIVYGFQGFWIVAITSSIMSTVSLCVFKYQLKGLSRKIIESNENIKLFASVIKDEDTTFMQEIFILILMKLCPLPYSLTNGGLGCVPHLSPIAFFIACTVCSPKYLIQIFMGIQLRKIGDDDKNNYKKSIDLAVFIITGLSFATLSMLLYRRLKVKLYQRQQRNELNIDEVVDNDNATLSVSVSPPPYSP